MVCSVISTRSIILSAVVSGYVLAAVLSCLSLPSHFGHDV